MAFYLGLIPGYLQIAFGSIEEPLLRPMSLAVAGDTMTMDETYLVSRKQMVL